MGIGYLQGQVKSDYSGYNKLAQLIVDLYDTGDRSQVIDGSLLTWMDANLAAVLGAYAYAMKDAHDVELCLKQIKPGLHDILRKNGFLCELQGEQLYPDYNNTTIAFCNHKTVDQNSFKDYIQRELLSKSALPNISKGLSRQLNESLFEVFANAQTHGDAVAICSCGQHFPSDSLKKIDFTMVNLGLKTIKTNVNDYHDGKRTFTGVEAIEWAVQDKHTTKSGNIPGGIGLARIREFVQLNKGKLQIISDDGFWELSKDGENSKSMECTFTGTIVNFEINLKDNKSYQLKSETTEDFSF